MADWLAINSSIEEPKKCILAPKLSETFEAKEARLTIKYEAALKLQCNISPDSTEWSGVYDAYQSILNEINLEIFGKTCSTSISYRIKYLCLKNIADMESKIKETRLSSLKRYSFALETDKSDPLLWYDFGLTAFRCSKYRLARYAFEGALLNQKEHWPSVVRLCEVLFVISDDEVCWRWLKYVTSRDPQNALIIELQKNIADKHFAKSVSVEGPFPYLFREASKEILSEKKKRRIKKLIRHREQFISGTNSSEIDRQPLNFKLHLPNMYSVGRLLIRIQEHLGITALSTGSYSKRIQINLHFDELKNAEKAILMDETFKHRRVEFHGTKRALDPCSNQSSKADSKRKRSGPRKGERVSKRTQARVQAEYAAAEQLSRQENLGYAFQAFMGLSKHHFTAFQTSWWSWDSMNTNFSNVELDNGPEENLDEPFFNYKTVTHALRFISLNEQNSGIYDSIFRFLDFVGGCSGTFLGPKISQVLFRLEKIADNSVISGAGCRAVLSTLSRLFLAELHFDVYLSSLKEKTKTEELKFAKENVTEAMLNYDQELDSDNDFCFRLQWLLGQVSEQCQELDGAEHRFKLCLPILDRLRKSSGTERYVARLPNCANHSIITRSTIERRIDQLMLKKARLEAVNEYYVTQKEEFSMLKTSGGSESSQLIKRLYSKVFESFRRCYWPHNELNCAKELILEFQESLSKKTCPQCPTLIIILKTCVAAGDKSNGVLFIKEVLRHLISGSDVLHGHCNDSASPIHFKTLKLLTGYWKQLFVGSAGNVSNCPEYYALYFSRSISISNCRETLVNVVSIAGEYRAMILGEVLCNVEVSDLNIKSRKETHQVVRQVLELICVSPSLQFTQANQICILTQVSKLIKKMGESRDVQTFYLAVFSFAKIFVDSGLYDGVIVIKMLLYSHHSLFEKGVCSLINGPRNIDFLQFCVTASSNLIIKPHEEYMRRKLVASCYKCMFHFDISADVQDHKTLKRDLKDSNQAQDLFKFMVVAIENKEMSSPKEIYKISRAVLNCINFINYTDNETDLYINAPCNADSPKCPKIVSYEAPDLTLGNVLSMPSKDVCFLYIYWYLATYTPIRSIVRRSATYKELAQNESDCRKRICFYMMDVNINPLRKASWVKMGETFREILHSIVDNTDLDLQKFILEGSNLPQDEAVLELASYPVLKNVSYFDVVLYQLRNKNVEFRNSAGDKLDEFSDLQLKAFDGISGEKGQALISLSPWKLLKIYTLVFREMSIRCFDYAAYLEERTGGPKERIGKYFESCGILLYNSHSYERKSFSGYNYLLDRASKYFSGVLDLDTQDSRLIFNSHFMLSKIKGKQGSKERVMYHLSCAQNATVNSGFSDTPYALYRTHAYRIKLLLSPFLRGHSIEPEMQILSLVGAYCFKDTSSIQDCKTRKDMWAYRLVLYKDALSALAHILQLDKYFHPARFMLACGAFYEPILVLNESPDNVDFVSSIDIIVPTIFDIRRSQVVSIWLKEKEELALDHIYQRLVKYDAVRRKYFAFYLRLLVLKRDGKRLKDLFKWVLLSKETYEIMDVLLQLVTYSRLCLQSNELKSSLHATFEKNEVYERLLCAYQLYLDMCEVKGRLGEQGGRWALAIKYIVVSWYQINCAIAGKRSDKITSSSAQSFVSTLCIDKTLSLLLEMVETLSTDSELKLRATIPGVALDDAVKFICTEIEIGRPAIHVKPLENAAKRSAS